MGLLTPTRATVLLAIEILIPSFVVYLVGLAVYNRFFHPLRKFPGPFWASITTLWYWHAVRYGVYEHHSLPLHRKYGPFVRISPNQLSVGDPTAIETIYGPNRNGTVFRKSEFYAGFDPKIGHRRDNFSEQDEAKHTERRRIVAPLYTQAAVLSYEPCVDRLIELFYKQMDTFVDGKETFDMSVWLRKYTFDVIGEIYYGRKGGFGMIRDNIDYNGWCQLMDTIPNFGASITYFPKGCQTIFMLSQMFSATSRAGMKGFFKVISDAKKATKERLAIMQSGSDDYSKDDMLNKLIEIVNEKGEKVNFNMDDVTTELWTVIWAGSDTTSVALTSIFYHLHKHPQTLKKLRAEIEEAFSDGRLTYPIRYKDASKLKYLYAVVMEGMRVHHSLGTGLPRDVPAGGATISGQFVPGNTTVIMNGNVVQFDKTIFGDDADEFIPERWLRNGDAGAANMERHILTFGYGPRICIGKHITMTEMYKLLPTILRDFEFELLVEEWEVWHGWFQNQSNVLVKATRRRETEGRERPVLVTAENTYRK